MFDTIMNWVADHPWITGTIFLVLYVAGNMYAVKLNDDSCKSQGKQGDVVVSVVNGVSSTGQFVTGTATTFVCK